VKAIKQLLRPERLRQVPEQFSWVDQALVQQHFIDRCDARSAALYLFLVTVADAQGLSYYGASTLARRLHLSDEQFAAARQQLIELELIAYPGAAVPGAGPAGDRRGAAPAPRAPAPRPPAPTPAASP
jgi:hypothetical protein